MADQNEDSRAAEIVAASAAAALIARRKLELRKQRQVRKEVRRFARMVETASVFGQVRLKWTDLVDSLLVGGVITTVLAGQLRDSDRPWKMFQTVSETGKLEVTATLSFADGIASDAATVEASVDRMDAARRILSVKSKRWIAHHDSKTRPTHSAADGQTVGLEEAFQVGGWAMKYPGDPNGPPEETANCRCVLVTVKSQQADDIVSANL